MAARLATVTVGAEPNRFKSEDPVYPGSFSFRPGLILQESPSTLRNVLVPMGWGYPGLTSLRISGIAEV